MHTLQMAVASKTATVHRPLTGECTLQLKPILSNREVIQGQSKHN